VEKGLVLSLIRCLALAWVVLTAIEWSSEAVPRVKCGDSDTALLSEFRTFEAVVAGKLR